LIWGSRRRCSADFVPNVGNKLIGIALLVRRVATDTPRWPRRIIPQGGGACLMACMGSAGDTRQGRMRSSLTIMTARRSPA
jgi:hypothetical protein